MRKDTELVEGVDGGGPRRRPGTPGARTAARRGAAARRLGAILLLASSLLACAPTVHGAKTVVIAAEDDWAPYSSARPEGGDPEGFAVDIVREAFAAQGITVRFVVVPFARCLHLAKTGGATGCFDATITDGNRDEFAWHPTPMFHEELAIFARTGSAPRTLRLADLEGRSVGYTLGYTYPTEFHANPRIRRISAKSDRVLLEMLQAGRVDYVLINTAPASLRVNRTPALRGRIEKVGVVSQDGFWVAFTRANADGPRMAAEFEQGLAALKASGPYEVLRAAFRRCVGF